MPKVVNVPPPIPKDAISRNGTAVTIKSARIAENLYTALGRVGKALAVTVTIEGVDGEFSYIWSLDREVITGSAGRILAGIGVTDTESITDTHLKKLLGKKFTVTNKAGKLYWG